MRRAVLTMLAGGLAVLALAACDDDEKVSVPGGGEVEVDEDDGEITIENEEGSVSGGEDVPDDFPEAVPLPDGNVISGLSSEQDGERFWTVTYEDLEGDIDDYKAELEDAGYEIEGDVSGGGGDEAFASFSAVGDDYSVNVLGSSEGYVITVGPPGVGGIPPGSSAP